MVPSADIYLHSSELEQTDVEQGGKTPPRRPSLLRDINELQPLLDDEVGSFGFEDPDGEFRDGGLLTDSEMEVANTDTELLLLRPPVAQKITQAYEALEYLHGRRV